MRVDVGLIVEGHAEVQALPILVRRTAAEISPGCTVVVRPTHRVPKTRLVAAGELERRVEFLARKLHGVGGILILVDADDECPAEEGPRLLDRATKVRGDLPIAVVEAKREFEAWFLAAPESLRGTRGLHDAVTRPADPESIRDAKGWLTRHMPPGQPYDPVADQPAFAERMSLARARTADSFDKLWRSVAFLIDRAAVAADG